MRKAKVFMSGNSQAVRIPSDFHIEGNEVEIIKKKHMLILREIPKNLSQAFFLLTEFTDDFFADGRQDSEPQSRDF